MRLLGNWAERWSEVRRVVLKCGVYMPLTKNGDSGFDLGDAVA
jgi:hypothetical protein